MENLELYNAFAGVPENAKKPIQAGKLKGKTDINPMWRIKTLTAAFGPCGFGWTTKITEHWIEREGGESSAWVRLELRVKVDGQWSEPIEGIGGSKQFGKGQGDGINDEAFKMAETDAISVACKKLGMGADVYWQANETKYSRAVDTTATRPKEAPAKAEIKKEKRTITRAMVVSGNVQELVDWVAKRVDVTTGELSDTVLSQVHNGYIWDDDKTFEHLISVAKQKAVIMSTTANVNNNN